MQSNEIERRITSLPGISSLNDMQRLMLDSNAPVVALIAPTGSGKTLAFTARMLKNITAAEKTPRVQAIVITPSRELAMQTAEVMRSVASGWKTVACYGGHSMREEAQSLAVTPSIIVATPGRLLDHLQRGNLPQCRPHTLIFDEYDKALELGFADEMSRIIKRIGIPRHIILTSATRLAAMPPYLAHITPQTISCESGETPRSRMDIVRVESPSRDKLQTLIDLLHSLDGGKAIVFVNHRESAERVYEALIKARFPTTLYHGAMDQLQRATAIDLLENGTTPVMVATDLAARGLDITELNHIIHYHLPVNAEAWTHRNGRTARQDATGTIYAIVSEADSEPEYMAFDRPYSPTATSATPIAATAATLRFDAGRKEKISRGDIVGFLIGQTQLEAAEIGKISVHDHYALVAVPPHKIAAVAAAASSARIKGKRVRVQQLKGCGSTHRTDSATVRTQHRNTAH